MVVRFFSFGHATRGILSYNSDTFAYLMDARVDRQWYTANTILQKGMRTEVNVQLENYR